MKLYFLLTVGVLTGGLLISSGCTPSRLARSRVPVRIASANPTSPAVAQLSTPKNLPDAVLPQFTGPSKNLLPEISDSPPPPQVEVVGPPPSAEYTWQPGHWEWQGNWTWSGGKWVGIPKPHASWIPGRWVRRDQGWIWITGYWRFAS